MNLFGVMEASGSAMRAERVRAEVVAANLANAETTRTGTGGPYHRQHVVFAANSSEFAMGNSVSAFADAFPATGSGLRSSSAVAPDGGVHIAAVLEDPAPPLRRYDPAHPDVGADGYVAYPDIDPVTEMVDLMGATRAYGLNGSAVQAEKGMIAASLEIAKA